MRECNGTHPSGYNFSPKEVLRVNILLGQRNAEREQHATMVVMNYVTRQCIRNGRLPLLETLEVTFGEDANRGAFVYASCEAEVIDGEWACVARSIEANRIDALVRERAESILERRRMMN